MSKKYGSRNSKPSAAKPAVDKEEDGGGYIPRVEDFLPNKTMRREPEKVGFWRGNRYILLFIAILIAYFGGGAAYESWLNRQYVAPAIAAYGNGQYTVAEHDLETYFNRWGSSADAHYYLGMCYAHDNRKSDAIEQFYQDTNSFGIRNREVSTVNPRSRVMIRSLRE